MKTKPTQQAIRMLNENGIFPDFVLCRSTVPLDEVRKKKIQISTNVDIENIISAPDIKTIYRIPLNYERENLGEKIIRRFGAQARKRADWSSWSTLVENIENPAKRIKVAIVGKYVDIGSFTLSDSYISVNQALEHAGAFLDTGVDIGWVDAKQIEKGSADLEDYEGVIVPVGFGATGVEGKIAAIKYCRENNIPFLGLCFGMQLAVVEYARNVCSLAEANSVEVNPHTEHPVIDVQPAQRELLAKNQYGGTMRLGAYAAVVAKSIVLDLYKKTVRYEKDQERIEKLKQDITQQFRLGILDGDNVVLERHRHRFEVNGKYVDTLGDNGLFFSGYHKRFDGTKLMEFIELPGHRFFVATQAHPEFKSRIGDPAPLFLGFVQACGK
jgi:CTP synthase